MLCPYEQTSDVKQDYFGNLTCIHSLDIGTSDPYEQNTFLTRLMFKLMTFEFLAHVSRFLMNGKAKLRLQGWVWLSLAKLGEGSGKT